MADNIKYTKSSKKKTFTDNYFNNKFADVNNMTTAQQTGVFYTKANELRTGFKPIFANETKYLPNVKGSDLVSSFSDTLDVSDVSNASSKNNSISSESLTIPPNKKSEIYPIATFALVVSGLYLIYKIIED